MCQGLSIVEIHGTGNVGMLTSCCIFSTAMRSFQYAPNIGAKFVKVIWSGGVRGLKPLGVWEGDCEVYAVGVCWKRGEWVFSIYKRSGEAHPTLKVRRAESVRSEILKSSVKIPFEVIGDVGRFGNA